MIQETLSRYMDAGFPILYLNSFEDDKCDRIIKKAAGDYRGIIEWSLSEGFCDKTDHVREESTTLTDALRKIFIDENLFDGKVFVIKDAQSFLTDPEIVSLLKYFALKITDGLDCSIVIVSLVCVIPKELENFITLLELDTVTSQDIRHIIKAFAKEQDIAVPVDSLVENLANALKGLSESEIKNILALAVADNGELSSRDVKLVFEQKNQMIKKSGILEMISVNESIEDIGGLENLKSWLKTNASVFKDIDRAKQFGVDVPKGVLIAGMPGCGKSLTAKAAADLFAVPLVRMDMGRLMGKYVGESESNMRKAIKLAEAISPCVLWIDEMEKAFAGIGQNGGGAEVTTRLFGTFLTWLQEKQSLAFVVATANDISRMPPELLRKGRFDEIFYVDLPKDDERKKIFEIHIQKRRPADAANIDFAALVRETKGYSGADIEGVVKDSVKNTFVNGKTALDTQEILNAIKSTNSLSEVMKDAIEKMREVYKKCSFKNASKA